MSVHFFGIRHHGPGCARSLVDALHQLKPDIVLVEGPPDAKDVLPLITSRKMKPPVALLIYPPETPSLAVYYPFTVFSPEWQALRYAFKHKIEKRFIDLPQAIRVENRGVENTTTEEQDIRENPLGMLAKAAGYDDDELWWEHQIEQRRNAKDLFQAIAEAMTSLRSQIATTGKLEEQREAYMRNNIRSANKEGYKSIAVVCGAWHVPALNRWESTSREDGKTLKGLDKIKVQSTWIPWTNNRLSYRSGYGAGILSPGWYEHLWKEPEKAPIRWVIRAAHLLRKQDLDASSASVIEAVRLAEALAAMRDIPLPGMKELNQAIQSVLCFGDPTPLELIRTHLEIGDKLGKVPQETPIVPLQRDIELLQRKLRLKPSTEIKDIDLDLRKDNDLTKSHLLHRLQLLGIGWGKPLQESKKKGTFHEYWQLQWDVTYIILLVEANVWGNTIKDAATNYVIQQAREAEELMQLTELLDRSILANIPEAIEHLVSNIQARSALSSDVRGLMEALPPLARVARYGDVRKTKVQEIAHVIDGLFERILIGIPGACNSLDNDAAERMLQSMHQVQKSLDTLNRQDLSQSWQKLLQRLLDNDGVHGLLRGWFCRLLLEQKVIDEEELERFTRLNLTSVTPPLQAGAWIEGLLYGSALLLLHLDGLWVTVDRWLCELTQKNFIEILPLLRRAFAQFKYPERRAMGEKVKNMKVLAKKKSATVTKIEGIDEQRGAKVLPILAEILGVNNG